MTLKEITYALFYLLAFGLAIWSGLTIGFTDTHTPPMPFLIECIALIIGAVILFADIFNKGLSKTFSNFKIHIIGLAMNGLVMAYILALTL
ncbi:hypothetical protein LQ567_22170 [Niabella pedocola]|uniref:Uncharacterized protein n=1 Tax=Niabella pedocola TaxID=1752077 RepID=A0ABS8PYZ4_9BACT|nr:hypothetical protein [Niabella pedocola]MCD2425507.1 hypothetical protein [Niabella pedocola]